MPLSLTLPPGYLAEQTVQPLDSHSGIGSQSIEDNPDIFPRLVGDPSVVARGEKSSTILEEGGERPTHGGGAGATPTRGVEFLTTGHRNWGRRWRPSSPSERVSVLEIVTSQSSFRGTHRIYITIILIVITTNYKLKVCPDI